MISAFVVGAILILLSIKGALWIEEHFNNSTVNSKNTEKP